MQRVCLLILLALLVLPLGSAAWGQNQKMTHDTASTIKGIKIMESSFDPATKTVKLVFINDREAEISAYHYCIHLDSTNKDVVPKECYLVDAADEKLWWKTQLKLDPQLEQVTSFRKFCTQCPVAPGESRILEKEVSYLGVEFANVTVDLVVWSNQTWQGQQAELYKLIAERTNAKNNHKFISATIRQALANDQGSAVLANTLAKLKKEHERTTDMYRKKDLAWAIGQLEEPESHSSGSADARQHPREFLEHQLPYHDSLAAEFAKQAIFKQGGEQ